MTESEVARFLAEHDMELVRAQPRPPAKSGGGVSWPGVRAGTYVIGSGSLTVNGKGFLTSVSTGS